MNYQQQNKLQSYICWWIPFASGACASSGKVGKLGAAFLDREGWNRNTTIPSVGQGLLHDIQEPIEVVFLLSWMVFCSTLSSFLLGFVMCELQCWQSKASHNRSDRTAFIAESVPRIVPPQFFTAGPISDHLNKIHWEDIPWWLELQRTRLFFCMRRLAKSSGSSPC